MISPQSVIDQLIPHRVPAQSSATAFAPSNIALIKYWGKREATLNLPMNNSLSISLGNLGTQTQLTIADQDSLTLNGIEVDLSTPFAQRLFQYLDWFRPTDLKLSIDTHNSIATAAGLASSASGFAALILALDQLFQWKLSLQNLSVLARMGSGSASRSIFEGFAHWEKGSQDNGLDSFASPIDINWPEFRIGILMVESGPKPIGSREAMNITMDTASRYQQWPERVAHDLPRLMEALHQKDFERLGHIAENNALEMHACMADANPSISFSTPQTQALQKQIWECRVQGIPVYFTQDAGPNLKLLFLENHTDDIVNAFPGIQVVSPSCSQRTC